MQTLHPPKRCSPKIKRAGGLDRVSLEQSNETARPACLHRGVHLSRVVEASPLSAWTRYLSSEKEALQSDRRSGGARLSRRAPLQATPMSLEAFCGLVGAPVVKNRILIFGHNFHLRSQDRRDFFPSSVTLFIFGHDLHPRWPSSVAVGSLRFRSAVAEVGSGAGEPEATGMARDGFPVVSRLSSMSDLLETFESAVSIQPGSLGVVEWQVEEL